MQQTDPPRSAKQTLPTMYDLPSEDPKEPGVPDEFHILQPRLLGDSFSPPNYAADQVFTATDLNLYYDTRHPLWYKRPDWFAVVGVERLYEQRDLRLSYVIWQEGVVPFVMVELLSPGTEKEDLGLTLREINQPPSKWEVYERILRIPYYIIFDRYTDKLQAFQLVGDCYSELDFTNSKIWMPGLQLGLGLWQGTYAGIERLWLRWYNKSGNWIPLLVEIEKQRADQEKQRADQEKQRADQEKQRADQLAEKLRELGINPDHLTAN
jgi:Uma2 family endonuclease